MRHETSDTAKPCFPFSTHIQIIKIKVCVSSLRQSPTIACILCAICNRNRKAMYLQLQLGIETGYDADTSICTRFLMCHAGMRMWLHHCIGRTPIILHLISPWGGGLSRGGWRSWTCTLWWCTWPRRRESCPSRSRHTREPSRPLSGSPSTIWN